MYAQTSPTAQYTLVNKSGKNSIDALVANVAFSDWSERLVGPASTGDREESRGKIVTIRCRSGKPARYSTSMRSITTPAKERGYLLGL